MAHVKTLVLIYNSFNDPLFQNILLSYIKSLSKNIVGEFHVVTFEQENYTISKNEMVVIKNQLKNYNIIWYPLKFHTGRFLILKKMIDFYQSINLIFKIRRKTKISLTISFANVASSIAIIVKKLFRIKLLIYSYEPHSEFMKELGFWKRTDIKFKLLNYLEKLAGREADFILTGTIHMVEKLKFDGSKAKIYRAPTAVDENDFYFRKDGRITIRRKFNLMDRYVFLYLGKFGILYYTEEIPKMCSEIKKHIPNAFFLVVTSNDKQEIESYYNKYLKSSDYLITGNLSFDQVKDYISASDMGISGVPPTFSQKYRSPTKVAEYLLCGIPYITTKGVSEDDLYAETKGVGVVIQNFDLELSKESIERLNFFISQDKERLRRHCRKIGLEYRSKRKILEILNEIYAEIQY